MAKRKPRPLTPFGAWVKAQSVLKNIELRYIANYIGILPQNLTNKMRGARPFNEFEIETIEKIIGEAYMEHRSA